MTKATRAGMLGAMVLTAGLTAAAQADVYQFTVNSQSSSLHDSINISTPLAGTLIGNYDATTNPTGTQTRPGLFGGSGNQPIPVTGSLAAADDSTTHPTGTFTLDLNPGRGFGSISGLTLDYLAGQHPDVLLNLGFNFQTFRTFSPNSLFIGNIPITLPIASIAQLDTLSVAEIGTSVLGSLTPTSTAGQYSFRALVPVRLSLAGSFLGSPIPITGPVTTVIPFSMTITVGPNGAASASWSNETSYQHVIAGPLFNVTDQAFDIPTILPPGGTAHLLLNGEFGDLTIDLSATGALNAAGQRQNICTPDFNHDGRVNVVDFIAFLTAFNAQNAAADINHDGRFDALDFIAFLNAYAVGC